LGWCQNSSHTVGYEGCVSLEGQCPLANSFHPLPTLTQDEIDSIYTAEFMGFTEENGWVKQGKTYRLIKDFTITDSLDNNFTLQVGIDGSNNSNISFKTSYNLNAITKILSIGLTNPEVLNYIDNITQEVSTQLVELGSVQNKLESALESVNVNLLNILSSRSTICDADIAEVSSQYIQQQILQQASATLLSSAQNIQAQNVLGLLQSLN